MALKARLQREWRFLRGLNRTLRRVKSIAAESDKLLCDDRRLPWSDGVAARP